MPDSEAENVNAAVVMVLEPDGPEPIVVSGATVSTRTVRGADNADVRPPPAADAVAV